MNQDLDQWNIESTTKFLENQRWYHLRMLHNTLKSVLILRWIQENVAKF